MKNNIIVSKMLGHLDKILAYCHEAAYDDFVKNTMLIEACVFNLSQIGELAGRLDVDFMRNHASIPWQRIRGLRNRIIHDYEGVNLKLIWEIIEDDIPELHKKLNAI